MIQRNVCVFLTVFLWAFFPSCSTVDNSLFSIDFSADSNSIIFSGIDQAGLNALRNAKYPDSVLNELVSVLQTPSESNPNLREMPVSGRLSLTDTGIVFRPDSAFVRGHDYLVITHLNTRFVDAKRIVTNEVSLNIKPRQKLLSR